LKEINTVIHLTKYPKGLVIKIAKNDKGDENMRLSRNDLG